tara:strand:+ start:255 stop:533 length:279 start_codon:yes stop_codon:yes gene_type:complete
MEARAVMLALAALAVVVVVTENIIKTPVSPPPIETLGFLVETGVQVELEEVAVVAVFLQALQQQTLEKVEQAVAALAVLILVVTEFPVPLQL